MLGLVIGEVLSEPETNDYRKGYQEGKAYMQTKIVDGGLHIDHYGTKSWHQDGKLHRTDGPAIEAADGTKEWWNDGLWHRTDGPAIEYPDGDESWYVDGERHREDGPAVNHASSKEWYLNGQQYSEELFRIIQFNNGIKVND